MKPEERPVLTVGELTQQIKYSLETKFPRIWVQGELSNVKFHTSGHLYFTLKDESAQLSAAMWRSRVGSLAFEPADGMKVVATGSITVYPPRGSYQISVDQLQPLGVGELQLAFERLKQKLAAEGLFDASRKRPLPEFPERIGIVTSETGAALQDIRSVLSRRMPSVKVLLMPVRVQGSGAAEEIAKGIRDANAYGALDVLIVGRGGGSLEDLWPFNEEVVARAIASSRIPIISAVGHEVDFSISDFVADVRAATPSAAAELVVRDRADLIETLRNISYTMKDVLTVQIAETRARVRSLVKSYSFNRPRDLMRESAQRLDDLDHRLSQASLRSTEVARQRHVALSGRLEALSPRNVLQRGYAMVRSNGRVVTRAERLKPGDAANIEFADGAVETQVKSRSIR